MKNQWHTKTLFIQWWKYKWAWHYETCIECKTVKFKHKWKWLCSSCFDRDRKKNKQRVTNLKIQSFKFHYKNRALQYLTKTKHKKKKLNWDIVKYKKEYYENNRVVILLINKAKRLRKRWFNCLKMNIKDKVIYFPFEWIEKPKTYTDKDYLDYKQKMKEFDLIVNFYRK